MRLDVNPDLVIRECVYEKKDNILSINTKAVFKTKAYIINLNIDCISNAISISIDDFDLSLISEPEPASGLASSGLDITLQSFCKKCENSYACAADIEIDLINKQLIEPFYIENEGFYLLQHENKYHVDYYMDEHDNPFMEISKCFTHSDGVVDANLIFKCPPFELDLSDPKKAADKISLLLTFS